MTEKAKNKDMKTGKRLIGIGFISLLTVLIVLPSCKKDDTETTTPVDTAATFSFVSNGSAVNATIGQNTLTYFAQDGHIGRELDIIAKSGVNQLTLVAMCWDFQNPPMGGFKVKKYFANPTYSVSLTTPSSVLSDGGGAMWKTDTKTYVYSSAANNSEFIEISSCDPNTKKMSGTFKFMLKEISNTNDSLIISGDFKNQTYTVANK